MSEDTKKEEFQYNISFNYKYGKVRVFKKTLQALGSPKFIQFLIKPEDKLLFIVAQDRREHDSFPATLPANSRPGGLTLNGQRFIRKISEIGGWSLDETHVVAGRHLTGINAIEFDLTNVLKNTLGEQDN